FDLRAEAAYACKDLRKVRADCRWSMNAHCFRMHVPFLPMADTAQPVISPLGGTGCYALVQKTPAYRPHKLALTSAERRVAHLDGRRVDPGEAFLDPVRVIGISGHYVARFVQKFNLLWYQREAGRSQIFAPDDHG